MYINIFLFVIQGEYELKFTNIEKCPNVLGPFDPETYNNYEIFFKNEKGHNILYGTSTDVKSYQIQKVCINLCMYLLFFNTS